MNAEEMDILESKYPDDRSLVDACLRGLETAWLVFQNRHDQLIYSILSWPQWRFNREDMEDLHEEIYIKIMESGLKKFDFKAALKTYVCASAQRACLDKVRGRKSGGRLLSLEQDSCMGKTFSEMIESGMDVAEMVMNNETAREIHGAFNRLKDECRTVLRLRYREEMGYDQISRYMALPLGTVCSLVSRCTARLIELIRPAMYTPRGGRGKKGK